MQGPKKRFHPDEIAHWFTHGDPSPVAAEKYAKLHARAREFALFLNENLPASGRETNRAFDALEELVAWSNAAIAREQSAGD